MSQRAATWALFALWAAFYAWSFIGFQMTEPTGDGFTRGLNRLTGFLGWQTAAGAVAVLVWLNARALPKGSLGHWLSRLPAALAGLLLIAILGIILYARWSHPSA
jgi:hypothetical protein